MPPKHPHLANEVSEKMNHRKALFGSTLFLISSMIFGFFRLIGNLVSAFFSVFADVLTLPPGPKLVLPHPRKNVRFRAKNHIMEREEVRW